VKLSFLQCYQILEISDETDWPSLRRKYKTLIQKSHPDRFNENSSEHQVSQQRIRSYNAAYKQIADFYQANNALPPRVDNKTEATNKPHSPRKKPPSVDVQTRNKHKKKTSKKLSATKMTFVLFLISGLYIIYILFDGPVTIEIPQATVYPPARVIANEKQAAKNHTAVSRYFTTGSSLGDVINIQGQPSSIKGDTWYYGESSVTFTNGLVSNWFRHPQYPLNVRINEPTYQYKLHNSTKRNPETKNIPYWNR